MLTHFLLKTKPFFFFFLCFFSSKTILNAFLELFYLDVCTGSRQETTENHKHLLTSTKRLFYPCPLSFTVVIAVFHCVFFTFTLYFNVLW